jgi:hypothetical protein
MSEAPSYSQILALKEPPRLADFTARPRIKLFKLMVVALLEHGGPMTMAEIASRLAALGVQAPTGDLAYSLTKAWHGLHPLRRETDGRMRLELEFPELRYLLLDLGLIQPRIVVPPVVLSVPDETVPVTLAEWQALIQHPTSFSFSDERTVGALLEAHGRPMTLEEVNTHLEALPQRSREITPQKLKRWRGWLVTLAEGPSFRLGDDPQELASMRRGVRKYANMILQREAQTKMFQATRAAAVAFDAALAAKKAATVQPPLRRAVIRAFPANGKPEALTILDLQRRTLRTLIGGDVFTMINALAGFDLLIGLDPLQTLAGLGAASERWLLTNLGRHPQTRKLNRWGRTLHIKTSMLISASVGISRALYEPAKMRGYLAAGDHTRLTRRLESDTKALAAFYRYGCLHGGLRLRWGFLKETLSVDWAQPGDPGLWDFVKEAQRLGAEVEVVLGSAPGWEEPWARARRGRMELDYWTAHLRSADGAEVIDREDIQAIRVVGDVAAVPEDAEGPLP